MRIDVDDPARPDVTALLTEHLADMRATSPPESVHALDVEALRRPGITFVTARRDGELLGCAALRELDAGHAEIKSMRTPGSAWRPAPSPTSRPPGRCTPRTGSRRPGRSPTTPWIRTAPTSR